MAKLSMLRPTRLERNATMGLSPDEAELLAEPDADLLLADAEPAQ